MNLFKLKSSFIALPLTLAASTCAVVLLPGESHAEIGTVIYTYDQPVNGSPPVGQAPWMKVTIDNLTGASKGKGVKVVVDPFGLNANEFISAIGFNMVGTFPSPPTPSLTTSCDTTSSPYACPDEALLNPDSINIPGDGNLPKYDLLISFPTSNNGRLEGVTPPPSTTSTFNIFLNGLTTGNFFIESGDYGPNPYSSVAKVQAIGKNLSGVIGADDPKDPPGDPQSAPAPLPVLGAAAAFQASRRLRRRLKPTAAAAPRSA